MKDISYKPLFDQATLAKRISELGAQITKDYKGEPVVVVGILKGSFIFLADLIRSIKLPLNVEFMGVSSYEGTHSSGHVRITLDLSAEIQDRHVLLVEDIVDTGMTLDYLISALRVRGPRSLKTCSLLAKPEAHATACHIDYVGFEISNEFVIGYGLDLDGCYRELPFIAQVKT